MFIIYKKKVVVMIGYCEIEEVEVFFVWLNEEIF